MPYGRSKGLEMENCRRRYMNVSENNGEELYVEERYNYVFIHVEYVCQRSAEIRSFWRSKPNEV